MSELIELTCDHPTHDYDAPYDAVLNGEHYGYPKCCVYEFLEWASAWDMLQLLAAHTLTWVDHPRQERKLNGTGYVPCAYHHLNFSEDALVELIATNRKCPLPFPRDELETEAGIQ